MDPNVDQSLRTPDRLAWIWPELSPTQRNAILMRGELVGTRGRRTITLYRSRLYLHDPNSFDSDIERL